jgi:hypothetical protein
MEEDVPCTHVTTIEQNCDKRLTTAEWPEKEA